MFGLPGLSVATRNCEIVRGAIEIFRDIKAASTWPVKSGGSTLVGAGLTWPPIVYGGEPP